MEIKSIRFIDLDLVQLEKIHGIEEAIARSRKFEPTLIFWRSIKPALTVGYFQKVEEKLNIEKCFELGIRLVRRVSGGSIGPLDPNILSYSIVLKEEYTEVTGSIEKTYNILCSGIVLALRRLGLNAYLTRISDVEIDGKKVSGSAQARTWGKILQHGFIYLNLDLEAFKSLLNKEKLKEKVSSLDERITWINKELLKLGRKPLTMEELKIYLRKGFEDALKAKLINEKLTSEEERKAEIYSKKFFTDEWNLMLEKPPQL
ncbi:MAG: lipoate--protein ligase family protein [Candidatus Bathyarchaeota archaeon]|nr:lipoate--protein ligase family protein [Candidatus Bathyarchaeota archaeon]